MRWTLTSKLLAAFALVGAVASVSGLAQMNAMREVDRERTVTEQIDAASLGAVELEAAFSQKTAALWGYVLFRNRDQVDEFRAADERSRQALAALDKQMWEEGRASLTQLTAVNDQFTAVADQVMGLIGEGQSDAALTTLSQKAPPLLEQIGPLVKGISKAGQQRAADAKVGVADRVESAMWQAYAIMAAALALAMAGGALLARSLVRPIQRAAQAARRVAEGDLTVPELKVRGEDEVANLSRSFNQMVQSLRGLAQGVDHTTAQVLASTESLSGAVGQSARGAQSASTVAGKVAEGAAHQMAAAGEVQETMTELQGTIGQIAAGAERTAAEVEQVSALLGRMRQAMEQMVSRAEIVSQSASVAADTAREGAAAADRASGGMGRVQTAVGEAAERIAELEQLSRQI
ncbi:MAG TPA: HAMP domain-containing protein, partial [Symbiobacteriaceae bacterium]|nr:HAMP domain-containing protein [Symbiobacteriaceae bacterium]